LPLKGFALAVAVRTQGGMNVAVTVLTAFMVTLQAPVPVQSPVQPVKIEPFEVAVVKATTVPEPKFALQVPLEQLIPAGTLVTVPAPVPALVTFSWYVVIAYEADIV
jgi:hypothetical protein